MAEKISQKLATSTSFNYETSSNPDNILSLTPAKFFLNDKFPLTQRIQIVQTTGKKVGNRQLQRLLVGQVQRQGRHRRNIPQLPVRYNIVEGPRWLLPGLGITNTRNQEVNFICDIAWETSHTSGFIIQEVTSRVQATDRRGNTQNHNPPPYWEAWEITGPGTFRPHNHDFWTIPTPVDTTGTWTKQGKVYWVQTLDPNAGFASNSVTDAGVLLATLTQPTNLNQPILDRQYGGRWDGTQPHPAMNTHNSFTP